MLCQLELVVSRTCAKLYNLSCMRAHIPCSLCEMSVLHIEDIVRHVPTSLKELKCGLQSLGIRTEKSET